MATIDTMRWSDVLGCFGLIFLLIGVACAMRLILDSKQRLP